MADRQPGRPVGSLRDVQTRNAARRRDPDALGKPVVQVCVRSCVPRAERVRAVLLRAPGPGPAARDHRYTRNRLGAVLRLFAANLDFRICIPRVAAHHVHPDSAC